MRIIPPTPITPAMILACNVQEDDHPEWVISTPYVATDKVIRDHKIYECLIGNTGYPPETNSSGATPKWMYLGYDNRWKMFDSVVGSRTARADEITVTIEPGVVDSIAFLDVVATEINVVMTDPTEGIVYQETIDMVSGSVVVDGYTYFFTPIIMDDAAVLLGVPPYVNATIAITISYPGGTTEIGTLAVGMQRDLGVTQYNPEISINDYSKKQVDEFGNYYVLRRAYSKRMRVDLVLPNEQVDGLQRTLASYRTTPVVWVGTDEGFSSMIIYGFYKSFKIVIPGPSWSECALEVEGLS